MFVLIANERGRHGFDLVGLFDTEADAAGWAVLNKLDGIVKPLVAPADWKPDDGSMDDEAIA